MTLADPPQSTITSELRPSAAAGTCHSEQTHYSDTFDNDEAKSSDKVSVPPRRFDGIAEGGDGGDGGGTETAGQNSSAHQATGGRQCNPKWSSARQWTLVARQRCGAIVNHPYVQLLIVVLIVVNAVMMGIGTFDFVTENPQLDANFQTVDKAFLVVFTIELAMQFIYRGMSLFRDGWLVFDLIIVVMSWSFDTIQIIRAFRIFRALRLITRIETLRSLVTSLLNVMPRLGAIGCLLLLIFYIFAVMFTTLFKDLELSADYFSRLDNSLFTLFQFMTMEWSEVARECMEFYDWAWLPFIVFVALSGFIVFNLIIAVICDAVAVIEQETRHDQGEESDASIDANSQKRIHELHRQVASLVRNQQEMQLSLEHLAKEYYALQGLPPPPIDSYSPIREDGPEEDDNLEVESRREER